MVCYKLPEIIFGINYNKNKQLFYLLQKAYADARYNSDYTINAVDIKTGEELVKRLYGYLKDSVPVNDFETVKE